jgi:hypothetical protein
MLGRLLVATVLLGASIAVADGLPNKSSSQIGNAPFDPQIKPEYDICILGGSFLSISHTTSSFMLKIYRRYRRQCTSQQTQCGR